MTYVMVDYHGHRQPLAGPDEAGDWFDEQSSAILPTGTSGQVIWYGPTDGPPQLRVDIDIDAGRAALTWLPDNSHAIEARPGVPITVQTSADGDQTDIPAERATLSTATTRAAVLDYIRTGTRPGGPRWTT